MITTDKVFICTKHTENKVFVIGVAISLESAIKICEKNVSDKYDRIFDLVFLKEFETENVIEYWSHYLNFMNGSYVIGEWKV